MGRRYNLYNPEMLNKYEQKAKRDGGGGYMWAEGSKAGDHQDESRGLKSWAALQIALGSDHSIGHLSRSGCYPIVSLATMQTLASIGRVGTRATRPLHLQ